jgi:hypothetical protein
MRAPWWAFSCFRNPASPFLVLPGERFDHKTGDERMDRREFTKIMGAVVAGMVAGSKLTAEEKKADAKADTHACKGHNECKGKGGCKSGDAGCAGKNSCKGKGGCASAAAKHDCKGKNGCKGQGGCKSGDAGCAGKNSCKGKGGCAVPPKAK